jgi:hypothetical protein
MRGPIMTDPEDTVEVLPADLEEAEADLTDDFERPVPIEAAEADVVEQKLVVDEDEEEYPEQA